MWQIREQGFNRDKIVKYGNKFLIGNLKLGVRGTLDEYSKDELVAVNLPLVYDQVGEAWRESVNAYNPFYTIIYVNGKEVSLLKTEPIFHEQTLNLKDASMVRLTKWLIDDTIVTVESCRFVSSEYLRVITGYYKVTVDKAANLDIYTGIDLDLWDINGPHLEGVKTAVINGNLLVTATTHEKGSRIAVYKQVKLKGIQEVTLECNTVVNNKHLKQFKINATPNNPIIFEQFSYIGVDEELDEIQKIVRKLAEEGYYNHLKKHQQIWSKMWDDSDIIVQGNEVPIKGEYDPQLALRYSIYHLLLLAPRIYHNSSIPARGISGQTYKGAIFWDTEIFMLPFYLNTDLSSAKTIINYRIHSLPGAILKAKEYGFRGAFYAWESQEGGRDACSDYNVTDIFSGRELRTFFKDKQVHISADIVYAINSYINATFDKAILKEGALEVILEVARFYLDYGNYKIISDRFEIWDVLGPDEYHERVNNNAFTNQMVKMVFETVLRYESYFKANDDLYFEELSRKLSFNNDLEMIKDITEKFYIQTPNDQGIIEQFDGYFKLKDISKEELFKKKLHPREYLGGHGLAGDTKIIKQADVIAMLYLFHDQYERELMKKNWDYYEPRTEHGSSLSASMYALIACFIDNPEYAYPLFMKSATVDLTGESKDYAGDIYIGGTHPAASGGAYLTAVYGFAGLTIVNGRLEVYPHLPNSISSIEFKIKRSDKQYKIYVSRNKQEIAEIE